MAEQLPILEAEFTFLRPKSSGMRGAQRYRCPLATLGRAFFPAEGGSEQAWIHDVSKIGIGLILNRCLESGTSLVVRFKGAGKILEVAATVAHSTPQADGSYRVGCTFARKLTADERDLLL